MARYKPYDVNQVSLIPVSFTDQIVPGSFEYALNEIVDKHIDMRPFEARYENDETGCKDFLRSSKKNIGPSGNEHKSNIYNKRIAIVEPVFGNLKNKGMDRFTLRGKTKVNTQWRMFSLVHNIEKIATVGAV